MTAPVQEADQLMPMMLASLGGHLLMMLASLLASVKEVAQLMRIMLASFAGTCQTKVHLMQVMLGPADAGAARFFGAVLAGGGRGRGSTCQAKVRLNADSRLAAAPPPPLMQMMLGTCRRSSPVDADDARFFVGQQPNA